MEMTEPYLSNTITDGLSLCSKQTSLLAVLPRSLFRPSHRYAGLYRGHRWIARLQRWNR